MFFAVFSILNCYEMLVLWLAKDVAKVFVIWLTKFFLNKLIQEITKIVFQHCFKCFIAAKNVKKCDNSSQALPYQSNLIVCITICEL